MIFSIDTDCNDIYHGFQKSNVIPCKCDLEGHREIGPDHLIQRLLGFGQDNYRLYVNTKLRCYHLCVDAQWASKTCSLLANLICHLITPM